MIAQKKDIEDGWQYFAFISYKRADSKWADWLYKNLQSYRLPIQICKQHRELPKRLTPLFLDKEELLPGGLSENLRRYIAQSKYFISICSRNSQVNPQYIDLELHYFLQTHDGDYTKVIPFIVDDSLQPEQECFSPQMQALCKEHELIGVNVTEKGKRRALLKVIACMHGLQVSELETTDGIRRKRQRILAAAFSLLFVSLNVYGVLYWWNHIAIHTDYYLGYVWERNVPKGVNPISRPEEYAEYYQFESKDGRVLSVTLRNYAGITIPLRDEATVLNQNASRMEFTYSGDSEKYLFQAQYYDYNNLPIICYQYSKDGTHVLLLQDADSGITGYTDLRLDDGVSFKKRAPVSRFLSEFDQEGRIVKRRYTYGQDDVPVSDGNGVFGYDLQYDDEGNLTRVTYFFSADGQKKGTVDGIASIEYGYGPGSANIQWVRYLDAGGNPVVCADNWAQKNYERNDRNAITSITFLDQAGERTLYTEGYASQENRYDGPVLKERRYYGCNGDPIQTQNGYAVETLGVNEAGYILSARFWDAQGNPAVNSETGTYGFDSFQTGPQEQYRVYVDQNGQPMMTTDGYAYVYTVMDEYGSPLRQEYRDTENLPCREHYAACTYEYDPVYHKITQWRFLDENGNLKTDPALGFAATLSEYDSRGYTTAVQYLDESGNLTCTDLGYAKCTRKRELEGNYITEVIMFYDEHNQPTLRPDLGAMGYEATTDAAGNLIGFIYLDENEFPYVNESTGCAGVLFDFDDNGYIDQLVHIGNVGQEVMVDGYARMIAKHDAHGNVLYRAYYDDDSQLTVLEDEGYAVAMYEYNDNDRLTMVEYYGVQDGKAVLAVNPQTGYAAMDVVFDSQGEITEIAYYGAENGKAVPIVNEEMGFHLVLKYIDETDNSIRSYYFGVEDGQVVRAVNPVRGCAIEWIERDANGNITGIHYLNAEEEYMNNPLKGYAIAQFELDDQGEFVAARYGKVEDGKLVAARPE